jgi:hypothetical protein
MTRRHLALSAALAACALAAAAPAQAKQIDALTVCGADGCRNADRAIGQSLHELSGAAVAGTPRAARHFRLVLHMGDGHRTFGTQGVVYIPSARTVGGDGGWTRLDAGTAAKLTHALAGRGAIPARDFARTLAAVHAPATSLPPEVVAPPASAPAAAPASSDSGVAWWLLGGAGALAAGIVVLGLRRRLQRGRPALAGR